MAPHRCNNPNFDTDFHRSIWLWPLKIGSYGFSENFIKKLKTREIATSEARLWKIQKYMVPSPTMNEHPIRDTKTIVVPIESLWKNLQF